MRLKSWESPRHEGRNNKGKGGSARARQLKKQQQALRKQLKAQNNQGKRTSVLFPYFLWRLCITYSDIATALTVRTILIAETLTIITSSFFLLPSSFFLLPSAISTAYLD